MKALLFTILLFFVLSLSAQEKLYVPEFYLGFDEIFDNREYFTDYGMHQTFFGVRFNPGVTWSFDNIHKLYAGLNYMYEFGGELFGVVPQWDLYYHLDQEKAGRTFDFLMGSFPKEDFLDYPLLALTDSLAYYRPNITGSLLAGSWAWGDARAWIDWMAREDADTRETIMAGADVKLKTGPVFLHALTTRFHMAKTTSVPDTNQIRDESTLMLFLGTELSEHLPLDQLEFKWGWISHYRYDRPDPYEWGHGWMATVKARWKILGMKGSWYMGDPVHQTYGERLYTHGDYARFDFFVDPFKNPRISSKIGWNLHYLPGDGLYHSQQVLISIRL